MKASQSWEPVRESGRDPDKRRGGASRPPAPRRTLLRMQNTAGNRAVIGLLRGQGHALQRVPVTAPTRQETLFNQIGTPGQASPAVYGGTAGAKFDMSRGGTPEAVTVTVKIRFVDQPRNASGADTGSPAVIPAGDPRRAWATGMCTTAPGVWNGRAKLVGKREAKTGLGGMVSPDPDGPVDLPLVFKAVPVWSRTDPADAEVHVFGPATVAGSAGQHIDSGHYYMNKGGYPFTEEQIYAHEDGHLIGLPDEYSQSNPQMHALLHDIDPGTAASRGQALDKATVERMVMAALTRPLYNRIAAAGNEISAALKRGSGPVQQALGGQLKAALSTPGVRSLFELNLPPATARLTPRIHALVNAATAAARNSTGVAKRVVAAQFLPAAISGLVNTTYFNALKGAQGPADLGGGLSVNINVEGSPSTTPPTGVWNFAASGGPAANANAIADRTIGALQTGRLPPVRPSTSLLRQLESLPAGWAAFSAAAPTQLSTGVLQADLSTALAAAWLARMTAAIIGGGGPAAAPISRGPALAAAVDAAIRTAATTAATNAVRAFLATEINPVLQGGVTALAASVKDEVDRVMATPAGALAATAPKDADIAALATSLNTQLQTQITAAKVAQAGARGTTPVNPGATAPAQSVTYGTYNMMSDNASVFRVDQFAELANQFNGSGLRHEREGDFHAEKV